MEKKNMVYPITMAGVKRELPLCPLNDELAIAALVIFGDCQLTTACAQALLDKAPEYDYLITAEAKGIPLAHEMARLAGDEKYFVARKGTKVYMQDVLEIEVQSITTKSVQRLFLDGKSLHALEQLVVKAGGIVCGRMAILAEGKAKDREDILFLEPLPIFKADGTPV